MNESILLRFESARPLKVRTFSAQEGLVFDSDTESSPLNVAIGLQPLFPALLDPIRRRHDWEGRKFVLDACTEDGCLRLSGFHGDPHGLPAGPYDITTEVESYHFRDAQQRIVIADNRQAEVVLHEQPDPRRLKLLGNLDDLTHRVIDDPRSRIDGHELRMWIESRTPRAARQACLLNVLAKLRVPPAPQQRFTEPLLSNIDCVYVAEVDRIYVAAQPTLPGLLDQLVASELWVKEGTPEAPIHGRLLNSLVSRLGITQGLADRYTLCSYRQGGRNCLQVVVAVPPSDLADQTVYADVDIDLGNPLWDLEGLLVHTGELLDPGKTDHLALCSKLSHGETREFMYYEVETAREATA